MALHLFHILLICFLSFVDHEDCYEDTPFCDECCLFLIIGVHSNLIIAIERVKKAIAIVADHHIKDVVGKGQWECIRDRGGVQFPVIYTDSYLSILFRDNHDRAEPCSSFDWSDESDAE